MLYLMTGTRPAAALDLVRATPPLHGPGLGYISQPGSNPPPDAGWWAADNGCVAQGIDSPVPRANPHWSETGWLTYLERHIGAAPRNLFAVLPDVVCDHDATLTRALPWAERVRDLGYPAAFAMQNGAEHDPNIPWDAFDCAFLAGDDTWKLGPAAHRVAVRARDAGKWVHMGRVNSLKRLQRAARLGCHSADGTYLRYGPDVNLPKLLGWLDALAAVPVLPLEDS